MQRSTPFLNTTDGNTQTDWSPAEADSVSLACVMTDEASLEKSSTLRKGLMWTQRDKLFSRWKERYFVINSDYLNCFKKGTSKISEMGEFLYKVKICDMTDLELLDKRGYLTICISLPKDGKIYLRKTEGIREWHRVLKECFQEAKKRKKRQELLETDLDSESFWSRKQVTDSSSIENWLHNRKRRGLLSSYSDSTPDINNRVANSPSAGNNIKRAEITLSELSALYKNADEADDVARPDITRVNSSNNLENSSIEKIVVKMRNKGNNNRDDSRSPSKRKPKIINRLSLMSDIELPDFGNHQNVELEKGIFMRKTKNLMDSHSNDSGNHSMSTNASLSSSSSAKSKDSTEDRAEVLHKTVVHVRQRESSIIEDDVQEVCDVLERSSVGSSPSSSNHRQRRSAFANGLQITHV